MCNENNTKVSPNILKVWCNGRSGKDVPNVIKLELEMHALCCKGELRWVG